MPFPGKVDLAQINSETMSEFAEYLSSIIQEYTQLPNSDGDKEMKKTGEALVALHSYVHQLSLTGRSMTQDEIIELGSKTEGTYDKLRDLIDKNDEEHYFDKEQYEKWFDVGSHLLKNSQEIGKVRRSFKDQNTSELTGHKMDLLIKADPFGKESVNLFRQGETAASGSSEKADFKFLVSYQAVDITLVALASKGHSLDEIMDPEKLQEEKKQTHKEICELMQSENSDSSKKLAAILYEGMNDAIKLIDDTVKEIDFEHESPYSSKKYSQLIHFVSAADKANNSISSCSEEIEKYARKKYQVYDDSDAIRYDNTGKLGIMLPLSRAYLNDLKTASDLANDFDPDDNTFKDAMIAPHIIKDLNKKIIELKKNPGIPHSQWMNNDQISDLEEKYHSWKQAMLHSDFTVYEKTLEHKKELARLIYTKGYPAELSVKETGKGYNKEVSVINVPKGIQIDAEIAMSKAEKQSERIAAIRVQTHKAYKAVWHSSGEYDKACEELEKLQHAYEKYEEMGELNADANQRKAALDKIQLQCRRAEYRINRYFDRKLEQKENGAHFEPKTVNRIKIMMTAIDEVRSCKEKADRELLESEQGLKREALERSQAAVKELEELAKKHKANTVTPEDMAAARKHMSTVIAAESILKLQSPEQKIPGKNNNIKFKNALNGVYGDNAFYSASNNMTGREISKFIFNRKDFYTRLAYYRSLEPPAPKKQPEINNSKKQPEISNPKKPVI